jgi:hypothetical protein
MPSEQSHREQAEYNEEAALSIKDTAPDWAVTMCFYAALHWVRWYAEVQGENIEIIHQSSQSGSTHKKLEDYVKNIAYTRRCQDLRKAYKNLSKECHTARYLTDIIISSREHYTRYEEDVKKSFDNLQIVKQRLNS